jgi:quinoprotein glucose dehydrogenase
MLAYLLSKKSAISLTATAVAIVLTTAGAESQSPIGVSAASPSTGHGDWPIYFGELSGARYSPQDQINASNFNQLDVAWRVKTDMFGQHPEYKLEGTPLEVGGTIYTTAGTRRDVIALDAATGELKWMYGLDEGLRAGLAPRQLSGRGVSYWTDGKGDERILYITIGYRLIELDAKTGKPVLSFGDHGVIDMKVGAYTGVPGHPGQYSQIDLVRGEIGLNSTPTVAGNVVIVGSAMKEGFQPTTQNNTKGLVRAWDVRTGKLLWTFHDIPQMGEFGYDSWQNNSADYNGNAGVWTGITVDPELGNVYLPVEDATNDSYGGSRPGKDLFADSLVCVDLLTGKMKWFYQLVHHPIWNYDMSSPPILADVTVNGRPVKAVAVPTKQSMLYVFDRVTGKPIWPIVEKPVPQSDVPGEKTSPTQPIPSRPKPYARNEFRMDDLIDFTPELHAKAVALIKQHFKTGLLFSPAIVSKVGDPVGLLAYWNGIGGTNWTGGGYDPESHTVFLPAVNSGLSSRGLIPPPPGYSDARYLEGEAGQPFHIQVAAGFGTAPGAPKQGEDQAKLAAITAKNAQPAAGPPVRPLVDGLPLVKPPYGTLTAIDLDSGDFRWQVPNGDTPDAIKNNPALRGIDIPKTGQPGNAGVLVTKSLLIAGDPEYSAAPGRPRGAMLRAYDKMTGKEVGAVWMPAPQSGSPMTYMLNGRQYIVVAVSGGNYSGEYLAFALPPGG